MTDKVHTCPKCNSELVKCDSIGSFCPNMRCTVVDDGDLYGTDGNQVYPSYVVAPEQRWPKINSATVTHYGDRDLIVLDLDAPSPILNAFSLQFRFIAKSGTGSKYVQDIFGIVPDVFDMHNEVN